VGQLLSTGEVVESALKTCSLVCRDTVALYLSEDEAPSNDFGRRMLRASAAINAAAASVHAGDDKRRATFEIASRLCREAAAKCRRSGFDPPLLRAAAACERAAAICEWRSHRVGRGDG
jgi:hypothetical protein